MGKYGKGTVTPPVITYCVYISRLTNSMRDRPWPRPPHLNRTLRVNTENIVL